MVSESYNFSQLRTSLSGPESGAEFVFDLGTLFYPENGVTETEGLKVSASIESQISNLLAFLNFAL